MVLFKRYLILPLLLLIGLLSIFINDIFFIIPNTTIIGLFLFFYSLGLIKVAVILILLRFLLGAVWFGLALVPISALESLLNFLEG
jgi:hypothetical protein